MQERINVLLDELVSMSDSKYTEDSLKEELSSIDSKAKKTITDLNLLQAYISNRPLQMADEIELHNLESLLNELEREKLKLLTDPVNLAYEAKQLITNNDIMGAISKIKELTSIVEQIPSIKDDNEEQLNSKLEELKNSIENKKQELSELETQLHFVKHRLKFDKSPDDIYNEIDCLLSSLDFDEPVKTDFPSRYEKNRFKVADINYQKEDKLEDTLDFDFTSILDTDRQTNDNQ